MDKLNKIDRRDFFKKSSAIGLGTVMGGMNKELITNDELSGSHRRPVLNLDGEWQFSTDPGNIGEKEKWFDLNNKMLAMPLPGYADTADGVIRVPGCWDVHGYGLESDKMRHQYNGVAWYRKRVLIPASWEHRQLFLYIGGVMRGSRIWVNGEFVGEHFNYAIPQEWNISSLAKAGKPVDIAIAVDSRWHIDRDPLMGSGLLVDYMGSGYGEHAGYGSTSEASWGGIWGHVELEARSDTYLSNIFVQPRVSHHSIQIDASIKGNILNVEAFRLEIYDNRDKLVLEKSFNANDIEIKDNLHISSGMIGKIPDLKLWTPDHPYLYTIYLSILSGDGNILDRIPCRTGFREIVIDGYSFILNGKRLFLRGYGDDSVFPDTIAWPSDKEYYLERLRLKKSYGFNFVRHHSSSLPDEYHEACDEIGMFVQVESPLAYGNRAKNPAAEQVYFDAWKGTILRLRNHPSIFVWCVGNEGSGTEFADTFHRIARELDPGRFFLSSDGIQHGGWIHSHRKSDDYLTPEFEIGNLPLDNPDKFKFAGAPLPVVSHEEGNYVTFPRLDQIELFKYNMKPFWLEYGVKKFDKMGLLNETPFWSRISERLYYLTHKLNLEALRSNPEMSGYHWWLFQDYWTTSNGIVDIHFRPKSVTREEVLSYNNDMVILQDGFKRVYTSGQKLSVKFNLSNFSEDEYESGSLECYIKIGNTTEYHIDKRVNDLKQGTLGKLGSVELSLPVVDNPEKIALLVELRVNKRLIINRWSGWLYPETSRMVKLPVRVYAGPGEPINHDRYNSREIPEKKNLPTDSIFVTSVPTSNVLDAVEQGAGLVIFRASSCFETVPSRFKLPWWRAQRTGHGCDQGTFVYENPVCGKIAPELYCDDSWYELIEKADGVFVDNFDKRPEIIIRAIESVLEGRDKAFLFQFRLGKGFVIASGLNHHNALDLPVNCWLQDQILKYAANKPTVKVEMSRGIFRDSNRSINNPS